MAAVATRSAACEHILETRAAAIGADGRALGVVRQSQDQAWSATHRREYVEWLVESGTEGRRGAVERPGGSSLRLPNSDPPCPGAGGGRARVPGPAAEPPCHGPRLRHLAVARATARGGGLGAQGVRRPVSAAACADEIARAPWSPGGRRDPARGRLRQPHEYRRSGRPRRGRSFLYCGLACRQD